MDVAALLLELYGRIPPLARHAVDGVDLTRLTEPPRPGANTIAWLVWHLTRVQDHHVAELLGAHQIWIGGDWARSFGLDPDPSNTGYGHSAEHVATVRPAGAGAFLEYLDAVDRRTRRMLKASRRRISTASSTAGGIHRSRWGSDPSLPTPSGTSEGTVPGRLRRTALVVRSQRVIGLKRDRRVFALFARRL